MSSDFSSTCLLQLPPHPWRNRRVQGGAQADMDHWSISIIEWQTARMHTMQCISRDAMWSWTNCSKGDRVWLQLALYDPQSPQATMIHALMMMMLVPTEIVTLADFT